MKLLCMMAENQKITSGFMKKRRGFRYNLAIVKAMHQAYCRKSFENAGFEVLDIVEHEYKIQEKKLKFGYVIAKKAEL